MSSKQTIAYIVNQEVNVTASLATQIAMKKN